jgi:REP element-mobilizing transposase RayT
MARRRRVHVPNSFVHVSHRCAHGEPLLDDPKVKALFLAVLQEVSARLGYQVLYYCLQDNHLHLILFTPPQIEGHTLSSFMHLLDTTFGHRLNAAMDWSGRTWQGRFQATGWFPQQRLWLLELLLWYAATNTARRKVNAVPAAQWPWGALYWLLRGEPGPVATTLRQWLETIYAPRGCADPVAAFADLAAQTERPHWQRRIQALERQGKPWQGKPGPRPDPPFQHDLRGLLARIRALPYRSWKLEVERHSMLMLPPGSLIL